MRSIDAMSRLRDAISQRELCLRTVGCNRHGHTFDLRYPGPMGWTKAYAVARRSNVKGPRKIIPQMKRYTEFGTEVSRVARRRGCRRS